MYDFKGFNDIIVLGSRMDSWVLYTYFNTLSLYSKLMRDKI